MKLYRHLFFDLDSTLWDFDINTRLALMETFREYNLDLQLFDLFFPVYSRHNNQLWDLYRRNGITKKELVRSRFELAFAETGIAGVDGQAFNDDYLRLLPLQTKLCPGALETVRLLSGKYNLHIITNGFREVQYKKMDNSGLSPYFRKVFISEEIGVNKPSPDIFRHAMKTCNARKKESLMIGDSWDVDIAGAMEAGMDQVWYNPVTEQSSLTENPSSPLTSSKTKTILIKHLEELLTFL